MPDGALSYLVSMLLGAISGFGVTWVKMAKYQQRVDDLKEDKNRMDKEIKELRTDVDKLNEFKINAQKFIDKSIYKAKSPLSLTEEGQKLVTDSGFADIFEQVKDDLAKRLQAKHPKTKYDAQELARGLMDGLTDYAAFAPIKSYAFKTGTDFGQILRAGAISLRDYYLSIHADLPD